MFSACGDSMTPALRLACVLCALCRIGLCDEMAFVDVSADDKIHIRSLDVAVSPMVGARSLFAADPMAAHDWANPGTVRTCLNAQIAASRATSPAGERLQALEKELAPLYAILPKNGQGFLDDSVARYGLHRYFIKQHRWSVKGLEPAGASWVKEIEMASDVKQMSKYMVPAYLQQLVAEKLGNGTGVDLHGFAIIASTLRHLAHAEITEYLYSVYRTLGYPISGGKAQHEVEDIVFTFMLVYAFGTDLEVSQLSDVRSERRYLEAHHTGWKELCSFIRGQLRAARPAPNDFGSTLAFVEGLTGEYGRWQNNDCRTAADRFASLPGAKAHGRVPVAGLTPGPQWGRRAILREDGDEMTRLGVVENDTATGKPQLLVPNYLLSQAMCLTTAGVHTVCCYNECDDLLAKVESVAGGPEASVGDIVSALDVAEAGKESLTKLVGEGGQGKVALHGRAFAEWMHRSFPLTCPAPSDGSARTSPKTPDEWMADPGEETASTEDLVSELSAVLGRYTTLGSRPGDEAELESDAAATEGAASRPDIEAHVQQGGGQRAGGRRSIGRTLFQLIAISSMVGLACANGRTMLADALVSVASGTTGAQLKEKCMATMV